MRVKVKVWAAELMSIDSFLFMRLNLNAYIFLAKLHCNQLEPMWACRSHTQMIPVEAEDHFVSRHLNTWHSLIGQGGDLDLNVLLLHLFQSENSEC